MKPSTARIEAEGLSCVRDARTLFKQLSFELSAGEIIQIEGDNGSGKTSLLRILCGLALPSEGTVRWNQANIRRCRIEYNASLIYIGHQPGLKEELTALENLRFYSALAGHTNTRSELEHALDQVGLYGFEDVPVRSLSAGQRRRVALARLWLNNSPFWILDEPFTALDRGGIENLESRISEHIRSGGMAILTSHQTLDLPNTELRSIQLQ